ncbi:uncharacterized protein LOC107424117 [Ziziphus jujuba]|uniref:Ribosomal RNA processing protein 1 homolog n=1 Tax=Ziziphus jujuba TaxID=326968 RepID=A0A6P4A759_ZIZJJ|nr:uncharacterized protein LOC107424117 [Ziziphus jujuba]XP_015889427.1 uncharacterized protein LOC107424117 [Ziziphus jujuba]XP_015889496.1 uncharacterized protein LOC107424117 [Ziziphus jujuba]
MEEERVEEGLSLIKQLAACDNGSREKALRNVLGSWLPSQTSISDDLMKKLWKGLFYCVWHSDKLPAQVELIDRLSSLVPTLDLSLSLHYLSVFVLTMRREWSGLDVLRLDKFYLLIRKFLHNVFVLLRNNSWDLELCRRLMGVLEKWVFFADDKFQGNGVNYHIVSVFLEELRPFLPVRLEVFDNFTVPFLSVMQKLPDKVLLAKLKSSMFDVLLKNGQKLVEAKKLGKEIDSGDDVEVFGLIALNMGFSGKFFELGSSPECYQGNRKVLFGLHEEFLKLEKDLASSGIEVPFPNVPDIVEHDEDEVPNLVPIAVEEMEVVPSEPLEEDAGWSAGKRLRKCRNGVKASGESKKKAKNSKLKKNKSSDSDTEKGSTNKDNKNALVANCEKLNNEPISDGDLVPINESVISNLQLQFEKIAAEAGLESDVTSSCGLRKIAVPAVSKKRKRGKTMDKKQSGEGDPEVGMAAKSGEKSAKKVKFSMKNNLVWKPQTPLPPQDLRLPPSVTPRGSALKKGVPPGPIREIPTPPKKVRLRAVTVKKARKALKRRKTLKSRST